MEYRPRFHFTAGRGWLNDPNGMLWDGEKYHLFFQHNPYHCKWDSMHWGHAVSSNLLQWTHLPPIIKPDAPYDCCQSGGCFSGSAVINNGQIYLFYTGSVTGVQTQNLAVCRDGITAEKYLCNPIIIAPPAGMSQNDFRDPKVIYHKERWYMVLATHNGSNQEDGDGQILFYRSDDLLQWEFVSVLLASGGKYGSMFECPDLFPIGGHWALTVSPMHHPAGRQSIWFLGDLDFDGGTFSIIREGCADYGFDYYAAQTYADCNQRMQTVAWMGSWPWMAWFSGYGPTACEGWRCAMTLPRICGLDRAGRLCWQPLEVMQSLRGEEQTGLNISLTNVVEIDGGDNCYELELHVAKDNIGDGIRVELFADEKYALKLDILAAGLILDRTQSDGYSKGTARAPIYWEDGAVMIRIIADCSNVEIFVGEGAVCITANIYPAPNQHRIRFLALGSRACLERVSFWPLSNSFR